MISARLRTSLLQAAIQGKLTEQLPDDGDSADLVMEIQQERARLVKEGKIKKEKPLADITDDEIPFEIPENWCWVRLNNYLDIRDGTHDTPKYVTQGVPLVTSKNLYNGEIDFTTAKFISQTDHEKISHRSKVDDSDILFAMIGSIGNPVKVKGECNFSIKNMALFKRFFEWTNMDYILLFLSLVQEQMKKDSSGGVQSFVSLSYLRNFVLPLPPLTEQKRIVVIIEELNAYLNALEKEERKLNSIQNSFPNKMKQSLLQAAIQGKLTEQLPEDGNSRDLVEEIQKEKIRLIKAGMIKKASPLPEITEDEIPFEIPENWCWVRLGDVGETNIGLTYKPSDISIEGTIVLRSSNIQNDKMDFSDIVRVACKIPKSKVCQKGDLLICARNGSKKLVGKSAIIEEDGMTFGAFMALFRSPFNTYILRFINSPLFRSNLDGVSTTTINQITQDDLKNRLVPFPPLAEQNRIVARLDELLPLCDKLE